MKKLFLLSLLTGCQANDATLYQLNATQNACANYNAAACLDVPRLSEQARSEAAGKMAALFLFPLIVLEAVALAKY
jgi:hypothetical protein